MADRLLTELYYRIMRDSGGKMLPSQAAALVAKIANTTPLVVGMTVDGVLGAVAREIAAERSSDPTRGRERDDAEASREGVGALERGSRRRPRLRTRRKQ